MAKKDIHKIDNVLLGAGSVLLIAILAVTCLLTFYSDSIHPQISFWDRFFSDSTLLIVAPLLLVGQIIRYRENKIINIWDILEHSNILTMQSLELNTGFKRDFIHQAIILINKRSDTFYVWDSNTDIIMDGCLHALSIATIHCDSCGANIRELQSTKQTPVCPYCGTLLSVEIKPINSESTRTNTLTSMNQVETKFSILLCILLLIIFWPAAILYTLWKAGFFENSPLAQRIINILQHTLLGRPTM